jgi:Ca2+-binding EF-hand superfamily protein
MNLPIRPCLAVIVLLAVIAPANAAEAPKADQQDLIYLGPGGPLRFRFHIQCDDKPVSERWEAYGDRLFKHFDADGNGSLDAKEFSRLAAFPFGSRSGAIFTVLDIDLDGQIDPSARSGFSFEEADTDKDGKVSRAELRAYLIQKGLGPVSVTVTPADPVTQQLTDALFKHLDTDKDGKLSKAELESAAEVLSKLDVDEDEIVTRNELLEQQPARNQLAPQVVADVDDEDARNAEAPSDFLIAAPGEAPDALAKRLIAHLSKNKKKGAQSLTRAESGFDEKTFAALDKDGNGKLDAAELVAWLQQPPAVEFRAEFSGKKGSSGGTISASITAEAQANELPGGVPKQADGSLRLTPAGATISVSAGPATRASRNSASGIIEQFKMLAGDKNMIERRQLREKPELQFLAPFFDSADRNGDGKLQLDELTAYLELASAGSDCRVQLNVREQGRGLFELLDTNHDDRLSIRELRNAWKVLASLDAKGQGSIGREQLPARYEITPALAALGEVNLGGRVGIVRVTDTPSSRQRPSSQAPEWFRKMDRNGDGDVSAKEFLGPPEVFHKLDLDGDGLISLEEALAAEKAEKTTPTPPKKE